MGENYEECILMYIEDYPGATQGEITIETRKLYLDSNKPDPNIKPIRDCLTKLVEDNKITTTSSNEMDAQRKFRLTKNFNK